MRQAHQRIAHRHSRDVELFGDGGVDKAVAMADLAPLNAPEEDVVNLIFHVALG